MAKNMNQKNTNQKKRKKKKKNKALARVIIAVIIVLLLAALGFFAYIMHAYFAARLPQNAVINGVKVGNCTSETAVEKIGEDLNHIKVVSDDAEKELDVKFVYDDAPIVSIIKKAAFDPRVKTALQEGKMTIPLKITEGYGQTEAVLSTAVLSKEDKRSHDAYIDIKTMSIVEEVYGNVLDYESLTKALAKYLEENQDKAASKRIFKFKVKDYAIKPTIRSDNEDLNDELAFDKEYIAEGLVIRYDDGSFVTMPAEELAKIVKYSKNGPKYYHSGAIETSKKYSVYKPSKMKIKTPDGDKTLPNYALTLYLDEEAVSEVLFQAAAAKREAKISSDIDKKEDPYRSILLISKKQKTAIVTNNYGYDNDKEYDCSVSKGLKKGIYRLKKKQPNLKKGVLYVKGGGSVTISPADEVEGILNSVKDSENDVAYIAIQK